MANVIDFKSKQTENKKSSKHVSNVKEDLARGRGKPTHNMNPDVVDMTERRQAIIATERRLVTRTVLSQFIGAFAVIPDKGLQAVNLYDISEDGLAFDMPIESGSFSVGETVNLRMYLSHDTYFTFGAKVANAREIEGEGVIRHGAIIKRNDHSYETIQHFVQFLKSLSLVARKDNGDRLLGTIK